MPLLLRDARPADADAIRDVTLAAYGEYAARMPPGLWTAYRENIQATLAAPQPAEQIVAEDGGAVVGTVLLYPPRRFAPSPDTTIDTPWPEVRRLAVPPAARGRGIGAALMHECVRRARRAGVPVLSLHTTDLMETAMRMYERMGFVREPALDFSPAPAVTIKGYRLDLGSAP